MFDSVSRDFELPESHEKGSFGPLFHEKKWDDHIIKLGPESGCVTPHFSDVILRQDEKMHYRVFIRGLVVCHSPMLCLEMYWLFANVDLG